MERPIHRQFGNIKTMWLFQLFQIGKYKFVQKEATVFEKVSRKKALFSQLVERLKLRSNTI